ncbi:hypothetical protein SLE2022_160390 [Rubroshorea leprosula]
MRGPGNTEEIGCNRSIGRELQFPRNVHKRTLLPAVLGIIGADKDEFLKSFVSVFLDTILTSTRNIAYRYVWGLERPEFDK